MDLDIEGNAALVTASSSGLGKASATALAREGADVVINGRDEDRLAEAKAEIDSLGVRIEAGLRVEEHNRRESTVNEHDDLLEELYGALGALENACKRLEDFEQATAHPGPPWCQWRDDARGRCVTWRRRLHRAEARTWKAHSV